MGRILISCMGRILISYFRLYGSDFDFVFSFVWIGFRIFACISIVSRSK